MLSLKHALTVILKHQMAKFKSLFDLQVTPMIPTMFQIKWPFVQEKKQKLDFQDGHHGSHLGFLIGMILAVFYLKVHIERKSHRIWPIWKAIPVKNSNLTEFSDHFTTDFMKKLT